MTCFSGSSPTLLRKSDGVGPSTNRVRRKMGGKCTQGRRLNFKAFLEVVKMRSLPWKDYEMNTIHSLQLILRNAFKDAKVVDLNTNSIHARLDDLKIEGMQELEAMTSEMVHLITVPILAVDVDGLVKGWNVKISELTGFLSIKRSGCICSHLWKILQLM